MPARITSPPSAARRLGAWGFEGHETEVKPTLAAWLDSRLGAERAPLPRLDREALQPLPEPRSLPELGCETSIEPLDRLTHARGQGLTDLLRLRTGTVPAVPDAVARPTDDDQVETLLRVAAQHDVRIIPFGGGTSVTGGVNVIADDRPTISVDLERLATVEALDDKAGLVTAGAGIRGPALEAALQAKGLTLGHFPQSFELSTLGGWIVTRSSGQESLGYGGIEDLTAGVELIAPGGRLVVPALPRSAAGPDLRAMVLGSEGRYGIVTRATMRVRDFPHHQRVEAALAEDWSWGVELARALTRERVPLTMLRLSDTPETQVAMAAGLGGGFKGAVVRNVLRLRGIGREACLLLFGAAGGTDQVDGTFETVRLLARRHRTKWLGASPGKTWQRDRFHHPYLRDALLDRGIATDTLETAVPWSSVQRVYDAVRKALGDDDKVPVLCHLSHPYLDGTSLYFTWFFPVDADVDVTSARWAEVKRRASRALVETGATISHHHGVGSWHAPWLADETGDLGHRMLASVANELDPSGVLNPHVLLDPTDRLER
ncbi:MAG: FAD-binding oxidoreductase [Acidobacteriota bacterium]